MNVQLKTIFFTLVLVAVQINTVRAHASEASQQPSLLLAQSEPLEGFPSETEEKAKDADEIDGTTSRAPKLMIKPQRKLYTLLSYPRFDVTAKINPQYVGYQAKADIAKLNVSDYYMTNASLDFNAWLSAEWYLTLHTDYFVLKSDDVDLGVFNLASSDSKLFSSELKATYCILFQGSDAKLCPGLSVGVASFPVLVFKDNTTLKFSSLNDMLVGLHLEYLKPISAKVMGNVGLYYRSGLAQGQSGSNQLKVDNDMGLILGTAFNLQESLDLLAALNVDRRFAKYSTNDDDFKATNLIYALNLGVRYNF